MYEHVYLGIKEEERKPKIVCDYDYQTDQIMEQRKPNIIVLKTTENIHQTIYDGIPAYYIIVAK